jgi:hypothetical protein
MTQPAQVNEPETKVAEKQDTLQAAPQENKTTEDTQEQNWRKFREAREKERKEKEAAEKRAIEREAEAAALKAAMEALVNKPQPTSQSEESEETEEQRIERKVQEMLLKNQRKMEEERQKKEIAELPQKLQHTFGDFNQVCSQENLDYFQYHYPEVAAGFKHAPDTFETWANLYKAMKRFIPNPDSKKDQARIEKNLNKPQSLSLPGMTQTGDHAPTEITEKRRQDNWARMQRVMKGTK